MRALIAAPGSYEAAGDDAAPPAADFRPNDHPAIGYYVASDEQGVIGLYVLIPQNAVCSELHATRCWGSRAIAAARELVATVFRESACRRIVVSIPATNRLAIRHAEACGFRRYGVNPSSFLKGGRLVDQILLGVSADQQ